MDNKSVFIKDRKELLDNEIYKMLGFKQEFLSDNEISFFKNEYKLGSKLEELGLKDNEFDSFEKYMNVIHDIYCENGRFFKWTDEHYAVIDIDRNEDVMFLSGLYNRIFIDGNEVFNITDEELLLKCNEKDSKYAIIYLEKKVD